MAKTKQLTLAASAARTTQSEGSWVAVSTYNRPITQESDGCSQALLATIDISALTGQLDAFVEGKDPVSSDAFPIPNATFPQMNATGNYAIRVDGPLPNEIRLSWNPTGEGKTDTFSSAAIPQG